MITCWNLRGSFLSVFSYLRRAVSDFYYFSYMTSHSTSSWRVKLSNPVSNIRDDAVAGHGTSNDRYSPRAPSGIRTTCFSITIYTRWALIPQSLTVGLDLRGITHRHIGGNSADHLCVDLGAAPQEWTPHVGSDFCCAPNTAQALSAAHQPGEYRRGSNPACWWYVLPERYPPCHRGPFIKITSHETPFATSIPLPGGETTMPQWDDHGIISIWHLYPIDCHPLECRSATVHIVIPDRNSLWIRN